MIKVRSVRTMAAMGAVLLLVLAACGSDNPSATSPSLGRTSSAGDETIKIGLVSALTGQGATFSIEAEKGIPLAVDEINAQGGINGRMVEVLYEDSQSRPEGAVQAATKLINVDQVDALVVHEPSSDFVPTAEYAATQDILVVNGGSSTPEIRDLPGTIVSMLALDDQVGQGLAQWTYDLGYRRAAILVGNEPYGLGVRDYVTQRFEELGGTINPSLAVELQQPDYRPELQQIADADPELIFNATFVDDAKLQFRQLLELGVTAPWFDMYPTVVGVEDFEPAFDRLFGLEHGWNSEEAVDFLALYEAKYGEAPTVPWPALGYDTIWLTALAIGNASDATPAGYASSLVDQAGSYSGPSGVFEFDDSMTRSNQVFVKLKLTADGFVEITDAEAPRP